MGAQRGPVRGPGGGSGGDSGDPGRGGPGGRDDRADSAVDFAVLLWREDSAWQATGLPERSAGDLVALLAVARQQPSEAGTIVLVSVADDFFVALRCTGRHEQFLLSDVTAAREWELAGEVLDRLGLQPSEADDLDAVTPAGDLDMFAELGMESMEVAALCGDPELYPDEMLQSIADRIGAGALFHRVVDATVV